MISIVESLLEARILMLAKAVIRQPRLKQARALPTPPATIEV
ncbi:hypothetical protein CyaNS01_00161 [Cyanobium sp. NS01]|nr:hypothetical protein CyaNS01_00161 [Cyanobium sp. NS01]